MTQHNERIYRRGQILPDLLFPRVKPHSFRDQGRVRAPRASHRKRRFESNGERAILSFSFPERPVFVVVVVVGGGVVVAVVIVVVVVVVVIVVVLVFVVVALFFLLLRKTALLLLVLQEKARFQRVKNESQPNHREMGIVESHQQALRLLHEPLRGDDLGPQHLLTGVEQVR